jgi:hypothetical protein
MPSRALVESRRHHRQPLSTHHLYRILIDKPTQHCEILSVAQHLHSPTLPRAPILSHLPRQCADLQSALALLQALLNPIRLTVHQRPVPPVLIIGSANLIPIHVRFHLARGARDLKIRTPDRCFKYQTMGMRSQRHLCLAFRSGATKRHPCQMAKTRSPWTREHHLSSRCMPSL